MSLFIDECLVSDTLQHLAYTFALEISSFCLGHVLNIDPNAFSWPLSFISII